MKTRTSEGKVPGYDPGRFPAFAVTVDVVILTMSEGSLQVLLIRRGETPYEGMWAIPGGLRVEGLDASGTNVIARSQWMPVTIAQ